MTADLNRRNFLAATGTAAAASALPGFATAAGNVAKTSDRLRIGFIGIGGRGFGAHVRSLARLKNAGENIELVAAADVYSVYRDKFETYVKKQNGNSPKTYVDYRDMLEKEKLDGICIGTPDHWHAKQTIDCMNAGKHVYCEKPMTHSVQEALDVVAAWKKTGRVMQVGVQSTSMPIWDTARELMDGGKLGKIMMFQTEYFRNSAMGQWRYYELTKEMTPKTIDWQRWLGVKEGLAEEMPFDREVYRQWRRFWPFGSGMYTDLFVHRTTAMLKATGLRFPARVVGAGGIFLEYDGRDVPDVATVAADFNEGVQGLITATMCCQNTAVKQLIRGHYGSFVFGNGEGFDGFDFVPERPQVVGKRLKPERIPVEKLANSTQTHFKNWLDAVRAGKPHRANNPPDLGAAAITLVNLGANSYRQGKAFFYDADAKKVTAADASWAKQWEARSKSRGKPNHIPGWKAGDHGSTLTEPKYMALGGPWKNGQPPRGS
ncbi:MAG: Gfo/Idh/MocA family protein [Planctomycetaceae bacterium]